jgi:uncharacterized membrane protein
VPYYDLLRGLHIIAVIAWMAAFLILPRLFIYQMQADQGSKMERVLIDAQARLFRIVMNPSMIAAWIFGLALLQHDVSVRGWQVLLEPWLGTACCPAPAAASPPGPTPAPNATGAWSTSCRSWPPSSWSSR